MRHSGICLSFDDRSIDQWFELRDLFRAHGVRATFFITQPDSLSDTELYKLKILQDDGHEIGFHGNMHVLSEYYIKEHSYNQYLDEEINKGLQKMDSLGFNCVSFAYPYGAKYWFTDFLLSGKFEFLRGVSPVNKEKDLSKIDAIYFSFDSDRILSAIGIDYASGITEDMIDGAIGRAVKNQEVLLIYGHVPTNDEKKSDYAFSMDLLRYIIQKADENNVGFFPMRELKKETTATIKE